MPVLARCTEYHPDRIYDFNDFGRIEGDEAKERERVELGDDDPPLLTLDDLPAEVREKLSAWARRLIQEGPTPDEYNGDRSKAVMAVTCALVRAGASDSQIAGILLNPKLPIHAHIREQKGHGPRAYVARQIERARERVDRGARGRRPTRHQPHPSRSLGLRRWRQQPSTASQARSCGSSSPRPRPIRRHCFSSFWQPSATCWARAHMRE